MSDLNLGEMLTWARGAQGDEVTMPADRVEGLVLLLEQTARIQRALAPLGRYPGGPWASEVLYHADSSRAASSYALRLGDLVTEEIPEEPDESRTYTCERCGETVVMWSKPYAWEWTFQRSGWHRFPFLCPFHRIEYENRYLTERQQHQAAEDAEKAIWAINHPLRSRWKSFWDKMSH